MNNRDKKEAFETAMKAINKMKLEQPQKYNEFVGRFPDWEAWDRLPYTHKRAQLQEFLVESGFLEKGTADFTPSEKKFKIINFQIKIPNELPSTISGSEFSKKFPKKFYLFRRTGRIFKNLKSIYISKIEITNSDNVLNYFETRSGSNRTDPFEQKGITYITQGSLVFLAIDISGHPALTSFAHVDYNNLTKKTPILDGHLLASTLDYPTNANFSVRVMLVIAENTEINTGVFKDHSEALIEFEKLKPDSWSKDRWERAFGERFATDENYHWYGNYYEDFPSHERFDG